MSSSQYIFLFIHVYQCLASMWSETNMAYSGVASAVGVFNRSLYLIQYQTLMQYSIDIETFQSLSNNHSFPFGTNQFWTQQQETVYMIADASTLSTFNLATKTYDSSYSTLSFAVGCITSSNEYLYLTGGYDGTFLNKYKVLQINTKQWISNTKEMLQPRGRHTCIIVNNYLYVIGGQSASNLDSIELVYSADSFASMNWSSFPASLAVAACFVRSISYENVIYVFGGSISDGTESLNMIQIIDTVTSSVSTELMPYTFNSMAIIYFEQNVYIFSYGTLLRYTLPTSNLTEAPVISSTTATNAPTEASFITSSSTNDLISITDIMEKETKNIIYIISASTIGAVLVTVIFIILWCKSHRNDGESDGEGEGDHDEGVINVDLIDNNYAMIKDVLIESHAHVDDWEEMLKHFIYHQVSDDVLQGLSKEDENWNVLIPKVGPKIKFQNIWFKKLPLHRDAPTAFI
eukprot:466677_1